MNQDYLIYGRPEQVRPSSSSPFESPQIRSSPDLTFTATQQLEQYSRLSRDFEELDQAIALLPATRHSPFVPSYQPFLEILCSNFSPTWTRTSRILSGIFGELGQATKREVPMGCGGIIALRTAVGRTIVDDERVGEIRHWLDIVTRSVYHTR